MFHWCVLNVWKTLNRHYSVLEKNMSWWPTIKHLILLCTERIIIVQKQIRKWYNTNRKKKNLVYYFNLLSRKTNKKKVNWNTQVFSAQSAPAGGTVPASSCTLTHPPSSDSSVWEERACVRVHPIPCSSYCPSLTWTHHASLFQSLASPTPSALMANMASASGKQGES